MTPEDKQTQLSIARAILNNIVGMRNSPQAAVMSPPALASLDKQIEAMLAQIEALQRE